ncbi:transmembrane protein UsgS [Viridothelium virens]|uniref:Transmembrane protein UsgS n=1 Tax=Viridothelium virens TaxID=1048519 RepID=A0A6A6H3X3_VIRVR|nr:transmembrane protein UsgS [Viridothelium virens]
MDSLKKVDLQKIDLPKTSGFDPNAILRGAQLTLVGANRALQNPGLFTSDHYRQAALAVAAGIAIRLVITIPIIGVRVILWFLSLFINMEASNWDNDVVEGLNFIEQSVLQVPFFLMTFMRYITPTLDRMFMDSLDWVDRTYIQKHRGDDPNRLRAMYYPNLSLYSAHGDQQNHRRPWEAAMAFLVRYGRRAGISLAIYFLSYLPYVGRLVLPAASFYTFNRAVGLQPALVIFGSSLFLPRRYLVMFLQSYFSSRSLMRELLEPYFSRIRYNKEQKKLWFRDREGVLFGFGVGFFVFLKIPLLGVLIYGVAEASTAFLITKITEPPPPPSEAEQYRQRSIRWENKHEFLALPLANLDAHNVSTTASGTDPTKSPTEMGGKKFS